MLALQLKPNERVRVGSGWVSLVKIDGNNVLLGFEFPKNVNIVREEVLKRNAT